MEEFEGHQLSGGVLALSPHLKWLATCGADGKLVLRAVGALVSKMLSRVNVLMGQWIVIIKLCPSGSRGALVNRMVYL